MPDTMRGQATYGADHYRPKNRFPHLENDYKNLFYCCNQCNSRKREHWPAPDRITKDFVPNPCDHEMYQHLRYRQAVVESKSDAGKFTIDLLDLNSDNEVAYRENMLHMIDVFEGRQKELQETKGKLLQLLAASAAPAFQINQDIANIDGELIKSAAIFKQLTG
jgi:hypothetical protein